MKNSLSLFLFFLLHNEIFCQQSGLFLETNNNVSINYNIVTTISNDGKYLLVANTQNHLVNVWDTSLGRVIQAFSQHTSVINAVDITADGLLAVSVSSAQSQFAKMFSSDRRDLFFKKGRLIEQQRRGDYQAIRRLMADTAKINRTTVFVWETVTGINRRQFYIPLSKDDPNVLGGIAHQVVISPDGRFIALTTQKKDLFIWDASKAGDDPYFQTRVDNVPSALRYDAATSQIYVEDKKGDIIAVDLIRKGIDHVLADAKNRDMIVKLLHPPITRPYAWLSSVSRNNRYGVFQYYTENPDKIEVEDLNISKEIASVVETNYRPDNVCFSATGDRLVYTVNGQGFESWDLVNSQVSRERLQTDLGFITKIVSNSTGTLLATRIGSQVRVWGISGNANSAKMIDLKTEEDGKIKEVLGFTSDDQFCLYRDDDTLILLPIYSGNVLAHKIEGTGFVVSSQAYAGYLSYTGLKLYRLYQGSFEPAGEFQFENMALTPGFAITQATLSPDSRKLAILEENGAVKIFDISAESHYLTQPLILDTRKLEVNDIIFSPTGRYFAVAKTDHSILCWDLRRQDQPAILLEGHRSEVTSLSFSVNDSILASTSLDCTIRLWNVCSAKNLVVLTTFGDANAYLISTPSGLFDCNHEALRHFHLIEHGRLVLPTFDHANYNKGLLADILGKKPFGRLSPIQMPFPVISFEQMPTPQTTQRNWAIKAIITSTQLLIKTELLVNNKSVKTSLELAGQQTFLSAEILLNPGENIIEIQAVNQAGTSRQQQTVLYIEARKNYALIITVKEHEHTAWGTCSGCAETGSRLNNLLNDEYGFTTTWLKDPTRREIMAQLNVLRKMTFNSEDQLLILFSGHGYFKENSLKQRRGYIVPHDGQAGDQVERSYISHDFLAKFLSDSINCKHTLLIIDACYSSLMGHDVRDAYRKKIDPETSYDAKRYSTDAYLSNLLEKESRLYLTAGLEEVPNVQNQPTTFMNAFLGALTSERFLADGLVLYEEIRGHMVEQKISPIPTGGDFGPGGGTFIFYKGK